MKKRPTTAPALQTAEPNIPCWNVEPKRNTKTMEDRARQKKLAAILAPLRAALERSASCHSQPEPSATAPVLPARSGTSSDLQRHARRPTQHGWTATWMDGQFQPSIRPTPSWAPPDVASATIPLMAPNRENTWSRCDTGRLQPEASSRINLLRIGRCAA